MSHNLRLPGCPFDIKQTRTEFTWRMVRAFNPPSREAVLDAYYEEYIVPLYPPELTGKDARNPYLIQKRDAEVAQLRYEHHTRILEWLRANPDARWEEW